ncbi:hypothetical protein ACTFIY_005448 [Dictyostelium cf. discoideum]
MSENINNDSDDNNNKKCFVTGSTGFLGCNIVEQLLIQGYQVYALYRNKNKVLELNSIAKRLNKQDQLILVKGDVTNYKSLLKGIPDECLYCFHAAALIDLDASESQQSMKEQQIQQYETNVNGTANVVEACFKRGVKRLIYTSTIACYDVKDRIINEHCQKENLPRSGYSRTKRIGELYVEDAIRRGLEAVIISPGFIIGKYDENSVGSFILMVAHQASQTVSVGVGKTNFSSADEVAKAHITAAQVAPNGSDYCIGGTLISWKELYEQVLFQLSIEKPVVAVSPLKYILTGKMNDLMAKWFGRTSTTTTSTTIKPISSEATDSLADDDFKTTKASKSKPRPTPYQSFFLSCIQSVNFIIDSTKANNQLNFKSQTLEYMINENIQWLKQRNLL